MKIQKKWQKPKAFYTRYPTIIDNIFLSYNLLVEPLRLHYVSLFFAKRNSKKNVVKVLVIIMLKVKSQRKLAEEAAYLIAKFS